jgi:pimeloyl-ACP methyl ester carboxylesterase
MNSFVEHHKLSGATLIGHSLGGYVALEMVSKRPDLFTALGLFHSTALADTPEKKVTRSKVVEFVTRNGAEAFTTSFTAPLFADHQHPSIDVVTRIAIGSAAEAVVGYTLAMRDRQDHRETLGTLEIPVLFICGDKDEGIPVDSITTQAAQCQHPTVCILNGVGHMAMFEEPKRTVAAVRDFLAKM